MQYQCKQGDVLDEICAQHYGTEHGTTEMVLAANTGLAAHGVHLPVGLVIELPDLQQNPAPVVQQVTLWD